MSFQIVRMKEMRKKLGIDQSELARRMNLSRSTVAMWETGRSSPSLDMLIHLCEILGCTTGYLLGVEDSPHQIADDAMAAREDLANDPDRKALLNLARYGSTQDVKQVAALIDALRATNPDFYDGDDPA